MCGSMVDIQSTAAEIRRGKKEERKKKKDRNHRMKISWSALLHRATIKSVNTGRIPDRKQLSSRPNVSLTVYYTRIITLCGNTL